MGGFQETVSISPDCILFVKTLAFRIHLRCLILKIKESKPEGLQLRGVLQHLPAKEKLVDPAVS